MPAIIKSPTPPLEEKRLKELQELKILDTERDELYDGLVKLASEICETPVSAISLIDRERQWFKASVGITVEQTSRDIAFCAHAIMQSAPTIIEDAQADARFRDNILVKGDLQIRFYAGVPLVTTQGFAVGTICVIDHERRKLDSQQLLGLQIIGKQIATLMELGRKPVQSNPSQRQTLEQISDKVGNLLFVARNRDKIEPTVRRVQDLLRALKQDA